MRASTRGEVLAAVALAGASAVGEDKSGLAFGTLPRTRTGVAISGLTWPGHARAF